MNIRGLYKTSLIDFPGRISSVVFTGGCNLKCGYCHNSDLALNRNELDLHNNGQILDFLKSRKGRIDGVTISGGEPTLAKNIIPFLEKLKEIPLEIKIDSNGLLPDVIKNIINKNLADYIAIDIKTSPKKYKQLTGRKADFTKIIESLNIIKESSVDYEMRTTCIPGYADIDDFADIRSSLGAVKNYFLQQFVNYVPLMDKKFEALQPYSVKKLEELRDFVRSFSEHCGIRGI